MFEHVPSDSNSIRRVCSRRATVLALVNQFVLAFPVMHFLCGSHLRNFALSWCECVRKYTNKYSIIPEICTGDNRRCKIGLKNYG